ncbi:MAG: hypothetical protein ABEJ08_02750 [Halobacteriaceae archaeon]
MPVAGVLDRLRQPEYTGSNRCIPCTVVNALIGVVLAAGLWVVAGPVLAVPAAALAAGAIYLRGYLVPGTPTLTKRYLPDPVLRAFGKEPKARSRPDRTADDSDGEPADRQELLLEAGAIEECDDVDDLCLTENFRADWRFRMENVDRSDAGRLVMADLLGVDAEALVFEEYEDTFAAEMDGAQLGVWESRAAFVADVASAEILADRLQDWADLDAATRSDLLGTLRLFIEECPDCGGPVSLAGETVESCCRTVEVAVVTCEDCGARLLETEAPGA